MLAPILPRPIIPICMRTVIGTDYMTEQGGAASALPAAGHFLTTYSKDIPGTDPVSLISVGETTPL